MVHHQRYYHHLKKGEISISGCGFTESEDNGAAPARPHPHGFNFSFNFKRARPSLLFLIFLSLVSFSLVWGWACHPYPYSSAAAAAAAADHDHNQQELGAASPLCSSVSSGRICCDRSSHRTDICFMKGDVRTQSPSSSIFVYTGTSTNLLNYPKAVAASPLQALLSSTQIIERIRPYTRKWETSVMSTIEELKLVSTNINININININMDSPSPKCDVHHDVPAVFFSTGGYTGNVYHEFNDGLIPLYITSQHFNNKVVFVILDYHNWWLTKYGNILSLLSDYPPLDYNGDKRTHCFPEAIVGLRIHDELTVKSELMPGNRTIGDFRILLDRAYRPRIRGILLEEEEEEKRKRKQKQQEHTQTSDQSSPSLSLSSRWRPTLVIMSRNGSRSITNEGLLVKMAESVGFRVQVVKPDRTTELAKIYRALNSSDVMVGVHGAAMTHFLFMKPGSVFIQVIPLGTDWAAATYYGEPAVKLGLKYIGYKIVPRESSLYGHYDEEDPVLRDPNTVVKKGWDYTKKIYLDNQTIHINLNRFKKRLLRAYHFVSKPSLNSQLTSTQVRQ